LNGGLLILKPDTLAMVATDATAWRSRRPITNCRVERRSESAGPQKAMTSRKTFQRCGADAQIEFAKDESHLFFQVGHRLLISRILTGQFPNYEQCSRGTTTERGH